MNTHVNMEVTQSRSFFICKTHLPDWVFEKPFTVFGFDRSVTFERKKRFFKVMKGSQQSVELS